MKERVTIEDIIARTPIIKEAVTQDRIDQLYDAAAGLFNLVRRLEGEYNAFRDSKEKKAVRLEILMHKEMLARILVYLAKWQGIDQVASRLLFQGTVESRGDVLRLVAEMYDILDGRETLHKQVPLIGVVGRIASGKGTVGNIIAQQVRSLHLPLSDRLREVAVAQGYLRPQSREQLRKVDRELKPRFGKPVFVEWTLDMAFRLAKICHLEAISLDGFRSLEEASFFKQEGGILIAVEAPADIRYRRLLERGRGADDFAWEDFQRSDKLEGGWIDPILEIADFSINNVGSLEELKEEVQRVLKEIGLTN